MRLTVEALAVCKLTVVVRRRTPAGDVAQSVECVPDAGSALSRRCWWLLWDKLPIDANG